MSLDNQDKQWISEQFKPIAEQFKPIAEQLKQINEQIERLKPIAEQLKQINEQIERLRLYVDERSEQIETKLLTEFHKWASATEARQRTHAAAIRALDLEMEGLDDRMKKLEGPQ